MFNPFRKPKASAKQVAPSPDVKVTTPSPVRSDMPQGERRIVGILLSPHRTEKTNLAAGRGWYTFRVKRDANRLVVKRAVEDQYKVRVTEVRIAYQRPKKRKIGKSEGKTPGFKKAMVKVADGQSIEFT